MELDVTALDMLPAVQESGLYPCDMATGYCTDLTIYTCPDRTRTEHYTY